ncbi:ERAD-associated E3 ubiquitin-protein ligase HRD1 [Carex littledalei]|uniref:RING-type E3 ubiquitin transferase n=1 Tax=Carex littledalei TaxID=544730 RepID=A0A833R1X2_9POAL|nr:ERAD-associated E3 ubiquitin-protein ligase HRD1 [Carex littledalei]
MSLPNPILSHFCDLILEKLEEQCQTKGQACTGTTPVGIINNLNLIFLTKKITRTILLLYQVQNLSILKRKALYLTSGPTYFPDKMMRLQTYAGFSFLATISAVYYAFSSRGQFYPAMVYLSTSKICFVLLLNTGFVLMCILWQLLKKIFLGTLREAEVERLNEQSWREIVEILFAVTIFRQDFSVTFLAMVTALLLIKTLHWLAQKRVEYIETTPSVPTLSHVRIISFMVFLFAIDCILLTTSLKSLIQTRQASVAIFFSFEYAILATTTVSTFVKYIFYVSDMLMEGQWEKKAVYTFYLELVSDLLHLSLYMLFFVIVFLNYGVPLHLIRELYETFRNFKVRVSDYIRYRKITSNMNERFPDSTPEELEASDATCIICREEMTTAKKLLCGHLFHVHCLRSWLERQHTCPTCRAFIVPADNGTTGGSAARQQGTPAESSQPGASGSTTQDLDGATNGPISQTKRALQAHAQAMALCAQSFVYPAQNLFSKQAQPQTGTSETDVSGSGPQLSVDGAGSYNSVAFSNPTQEVARIKAELGSLQTHLKLLQTRLQVLEQQGDKKGKAVITPNSDSAPNVKSETNSHMG